MRQPRGIIRKITITYMSLDTDQFVALLNRISPGTSAVVAEHREDNEGELLLHPLVADVLRYCTREFHEGDRSVSAAILDLVARGLEVGDYYVNNAVAVSFVESFGAWEGETPGFLASWPTALRDELESQRQWTPD